MKTDVISIAREIQKTVGKENIRKLSQVNQWRSAWHFFSEWLMIIGMIWLSETFWHPLLYLFAIVFIGARMHAFIALTHDGAHYLLFKNKKLNDAITMLFATWPILGSLYRYRNDHFPHHNFLNSRKDPDYVIFSINEDFDFPSSRKKLWLILLKDFTGITAVSNIYYNLKKLYYQKRYGSKQMTKNTSLNFGGWYLWVKALYYVTVVLVISLIFGWKIVLLYWLIPFATWFQFVFRLRTIAEHYALPDEDVLIGTRNVIPLFLENLLLVPKNLNYHLDHHLFPSVPLHNLKKLHRLLWQDPFYRERSHNLSSYFSVFKEIMGKGRGTQFQHG